MSVSKITGVTSQYDLNNSIKSKDHHEKQEEKTKGIQVDSAVIYEKDQAAEDVNKTNHKDTKTIEKLLAEAEKREKQLRNLVEKMLLKQGQTLTNTTDIYTLLREGKVLVDPATSAKAQEEISEEGYWGVNQTSDRLVSFAKALSGNDPTKADLMIEAVMKGYEEATKAWGGELPAICKHTLDATISKLNDWKNSI